MKHCISCGFLIVNSENIYPSQAIVKCANCIREEQGFLDTILQRIKNKHKFSSCHGSSHVIHLRIEEVINMSTVHPRLNVVLEQKLYNAIKSISKRDGTSMSMTARDLIKEAVELEEDMYWQKIAEQREKTFKKKKGLTHEKIW